ncbi:MAG: hypothetical protein AUJ07_08440 [Crenarchaeota archaeon 13_1_40CM_3_53_5]|nr:MAG: hypothetical protein AUJ07_08440 [Crenarchaeota archaeon 13_1_40CM_3_53_5]
MSELFPSSDSHRCTEQPTVVGGTFGFAWSCQHHSQKVVELQTVISATRLNVDGAMEGSLPQPAVFESGRDARKALPLIALLIGTGEESASSCNLFTALLLLGSMHIEFTRPVIADGPGNAIS